MAKESEKEIILGIPEDENEFKNIIRDKYKMNNKYAKTVREIVDSIIKRYKDEIDGLILDIENIVDNEFSKDSRISDEDLQRYVLKLPAVMYRFGELVENAGLEAEIADVLAEYELNNALVTVEGRDASERKAKAKNIVLPDEMVRVIKEQVYRELKGKLERATAVFKGLRAVMDKRIADQWVFKQEMK